MTYVLPVTSPSEDQQGAGAPSAEGDESVESGAIIRSPAPQPTDEPGDAPTRWPWESSSGTSADGAQTPKVEVGPTVRTEKLYRTHHEAAPESPVTEPVSEAGATAVVPAVIDVTAGAAADGQGVPETISPMSTAVAADPAAIVAESRPERGLGTWGVVLLVTGITTVVGFVDMTMNREFTWFTGVAFVVASILGALMVRPRDLWTAVITPPLAFVAALLIAGQPTTLTGSGSLVLRELSLLGTGLAFNAPYIFGGTAAAFVIVLIRRAIIGKRK